MYRELRQYFWWNNIKKEVAKYVNKCLICQKVQAEPQHPVGGLRPLKLSTQKWDLIAMDLLSNYLHSVERRMSIG